MSLTALIIIVILVLFIQWTKMQGDND